MDSCSQFHQQFTHAFFVWKCFAQPSLVTFQLCNFRHKNIGAKCAHKIVDEIDTGGKLVEKQTFSSISLYFFLSLYFLFPNLSLCISNYLSITISLSLLPLLLSFFASFCVCARVSTRVKVENVFLFLLIKTNCTRKWVDDSPKLNQN